MDNLNSSSAAVGFPSTSTVSSGSLKTKISLKEGYSRPLLVCSFYLMKPELPQRSVLLGSNDLLSKYDMGSAYQRFCNTKKMREDLNSFLPHLVGNFNFDSSLEFSLILDLLTCGIQTLILLVFSSLMRLVEKPPITGKEITSLSASAMAGFRLSPGVVPEQYRYFEKKMNDFDPDTGDEMSEDGKHKRKYKHLDSEWKFKKHRGDDKDRKQKKKKKDKKR
uniref:Mediator of RNA polymerase II transcription subunit 19 n=1 Tax=Syphacia muris TaxID=451379 RepID=A0A0N5ACR7_9BILA